MTYTPSRAQWASGAAGGTLIRALDMNHIEGGIVQVSSDVDGIFVTLADQAQDISDLSSQVAILTDRLNKLSTTP